MLSVLLTICHVFVAVFLVLVVLLQTGKRADLAGAFGGGGSQTAFGTRGAATLLSKLTTAAAVAFMVTSLGLSLVTSRAAGGGGSVLEKVPAPAEQQSAPAGGSGDAQQLPVSQVDETETPAGDQAPADPARP